MEFPRLKPAQLSDGPIVYHRAHSSTNDRAKQLAEQGAAEATVVVCDEQTCGRGRHGREWFSAPGALTFSYVVRDLVPEMKLLPLATALAVSEACDRVAGLKSGIKWPNDLIVGDRKLCGILVEARPRNDWAVIGIGLNVNVRREQMPEELRGTATSLIDEVGAEIDRGELMRQITERMAHWVDSLRSGRRQELLKAYRERDALRGRMVTWSANGAEHRGRAEKIDDEGNLVVSAEGKSLTLRAREVHLLKKLLGWNSVDL